MQLNNILEENSIQSIADKTKIAEENLDYLVALEFDALTKVKALGFISILEREYKADLSALRTQAEEYYGEKRVGTLFLTGEVIVDDNRRKSKLFIFVVFLLMVVSSWYFFTQFDKKNLNDLLPFIENYQNNIEAADVDKTILE